MNFSFKGVGASRPLSYLCAFIIGLLVIAPNIPYEVPLITNTFHWCYLAVVSGMLGFLLLRSDLPTVLKILPVYLFVTCFISQSPYVSFNAYILIVATFWLFIFFQKCNFEIVIDVIEAAFWLQVVLTIMQLAGMDTLLNFGASVRLDDKGDLLSIGLGEVRVPVFFGTVMQYMRFASVLAIMSPFLILRNRAYLFLIITLCLISRSSTFAMSLIAGLGVYFLLSLKSVKNRLRVIVYGLLGVLSYAVYDYGSFEGAIDPANGGRLYSWGIIFKTWFTDTAAASGNNFTGPFNWQWFLFGHGIDTFLGLFPVYKHDINPFPQAHNCWLQFPWEIGLVGLILILIYVFSLVTRLYERRAYALISGLACIATNMFFAFPTRMTQTELLIVAYLALCEIFLKAGRQYRCGE